MYISSVQKISKYVQIKNCKNMIPINKNATLFKVSQIIPYAK